MKIEYAKEGMKITHPTGVVQVLNIEDLTRLRNSREQRKMKITEGTTRINAHITETQKSMSLK